MANEEYFFPKITDGNWWKVRALFKQKVPAIVTPSYLANALSMTEASAKSNVITTFKKLGILDEECKPTDLAYDWRDDDKYKKVCETLIEKIYPQEVQDLFHNSDLDIQKLQSWFMNYARCGEAAGRMFAKFYFLLLKADLTEADNISLNKEAKIKISKK